MRNLSSTFRHEMYYNSHDYDHKAVITLADNTVLTLTNTTLWTGGFSTDDAVSDDNSFTALGSTIIGAGKIIINNIDERFSQYDFTNAKVELSLSKTYMLNGTSTTESIRIGRYTTDECIYNGGTITLSLLDNMEQFDRPYSSNLTYPVTLLQIVENACLDCGVTLETYTFPHSNYRVSTKPDEEAITYREVLGWVATIAGCFARCNSDGKLELKWFDTNTLANLNEGLDGGMFDSVNPYASGDNADGGSFNPWNTGYDYDEGSFSSRRNIHYLNRLYSQTIGVDDIVITGIHIVIEESDENGNLKNKEYSFGQNGYIIKIEGNKLINKDNVAEIGTWLATAIVGMRFRNVNVTHIDDPSIEAGDIGIVIDRKQNEYPILITRTSYSAGASQTTVCGAESPSRNSAKRFSDATKAYVDARKLLNQERTRREQAVQALTQALAAKSGLYSTQETAQGGGTIYYLHDKPLLEDSLVVWKMTAEAWGVSTDGGETWNAGMMVNGDVVARILSAIGVNADWINVGTLNVLDPDTQMETFYADYASGNVIIRAKNSDGDVIFDLNSNTGALDIIANTFRLVSGNTTKSISDITEDLLDTEMTQENIFNVLTNNGEIQGIVLQNGKLYINWEYARGGALTLGGLNNTNGFLQVQDASDETIVKLDKDGIKVGNGSTLGSNQIIEIGADGIGIKALNSAAPGKLFGRDASGNKKTSIHMADMTSQQAWTESNIANSGYTISMSGINMYSETTTALNAKNLVFGYYEKDDIDMYGGYPTILAFTANNGFHMANGRLFYHSPNTHSLSSVSPLYVSSTGEIAIASSTSSRRYKHVYNKVTENDIKNAYNIKVYMAKYKEGHLAPSDPRNDKIYPMFVAEQMQKHLPIAVDLNEQGQAETWNERVLIPIMFQMIKDQKTQLDNQQREIQELKSKIDRIEAKLSNI